jgi:hypothetical protein
MAAPSGLNGFILSGSRDDASVSRSWLADSTVMNTTQLIIT